MKRRYLIFLFLLSITHAFSQATIEGYEYWFNNDFANKTTTTVVSAPQLLINQTISTSGLPVGINNLYFRSYDNLGRYSSTLCHYFYKTSIPESNPSPKLIACQYWLDDNYAQAVTVNTPIQELVNINEMLSLSSLNSGVHKLNIRFKDNANLWSSMVSHYFYKTAITEANPKIVAYQYWLDDNYAQAVTVNTPVQELVNINEMLSLSSLSSGVHKLNIRFKDNANLWSSMVSHYFYKTAITEANPKIVAYQYWLDDNYAQAVTVNTPVQELVNINEMLSLSSLNSGVHKLNIRFKDNANLWSSMVSHYFYKTAITEANPKIVAYQYWLDDNYAQAVTVNTPVQELVNINEMLSLSSLNSGVHKLNIRFKDNANLWSSMVSHYFYKTAFPESNPSPKLIACQYWLDDNYAQAVTVNTPVQELVNINEMLSLSSLNSGVHKLNIRFKDNANLWSSMVSHYFYKTAITEANPKIVAYQYWLDDNYAQAVTVNTPIQELVNINEMFSLSSLSNGVHRFNIRFKENTNLWSSTVNHLFYKVPEQIVSQNVITDYRYWFNNDFANVVNISLTPGQQINWIDNIDLTTFPKGKYEINFQFKDTLGYWSVVMSDSIEKITLPIANFSFSEVPYCDSTLVTFVDKSIDGDTYLWNFGDGKTDTTANPTHAFYTPNTYLVSLTVTDTLLDIDSTIVLPIVVNSLQTSSTINQTVCDSYTAPDGQVYTTSGVKTAIIPNVVGCDSTITINLTINNSTTGIDTKTACGSFTWIDGNTYSTSNNTATHIITAGAANGCDSTVTLNLTVNQPTAQTITISACDSYTAPDGQVYTTSGVKTAIIPNVAGCDSTITINLTINKVDVTVTQNQLTLTANTTGANYQWLDCSNGYAIINGETNQSYTAVANGSYAVKITQNTCVDTSDCYTIATVGIIENTFNHKITAYPNPTYGMLKVDLAEKLAFFTVEISDIAGNLISQSTYQNTAMFEINLQVQPGIYLMKIQSGNRKAVLRIVKN